MVRRAAELIRALSGFVVEDRAQEELAHALRSAGVPAAAVADAIVAGLELPFPAASTAVFGAGAPLALATIGAAVSATLGLGALLGGVRPLAALPLAAVVPAVAGAFAGVGASRRREETSRRAIAVADALVHAGVGAELAVRAARFLAADAAADVDRRLNVDLGPGTEPRAAIGLAVAELMQPPRAARRQTLAVLAPSLAAGWVAVVFWGLYFGVLGATMGDLVP